MARASRSVCLWLALVVIACVASEARAAVCFTRWADPEVRNCYGILNVLTSRNYVLLVPESARRQSGPVPLVLDYHGALSNPDNQLDSSCWRALAEELGIVVAYPQGTGLLKTFDAGECCPPPPPGGRDDVRFARDLVDDVVARLANEQLTIDRERVYAFGFSNGGKMAYHLACMAPDLIAGASCSAQVYSLAPGETCPGEAFVPLVEFRGLDDPIIPYSTESVERWAADMSCDTTPSGAWSVTPLDGEPTDPDLPVLSVCQEFQGCASGLALCTIDHGHLLHENQDNLDMCRTSWEFWNRAR